MSLGVVAKVFNNRSGNTFHPKIYLFANEERQAELFIGSNNLTKGGLFTNYEAATRTTYFFPQDKDDYISAKNSLERYLNPLDKIALPLTEELVEILAARSDVLTEEEKEIQQQTQRAIKTEKNIPESPFGSEKIKRPPTPTKSVDLNDIPTKTTVDASKAEASSTTMAPQAKSLFRFTEENLNLHKTANLQLRQREVWCNDGKNEYRLIPSRDSQAKHYSNADVTYRDIVAEDGNIYTFVAVNATNNYPLCVVQYKTGEINVFWGKQLNSLTRTIIDNPERLKLGHL